MSNGRGWSSKEQLMKKLILLRYTWMVDVRILRIEWACVTKLVSEMMLTEGNC